MMQLMNECIEACMACHRACQEAIAECLGTNNSGIDMECMSDLMDCSEICVVSANFMLRGSDHHTLSCEICAEICSACSESCEAVGGTLMSTCAQICRRCSELCGEMAVHA